MYLVGHFYLVQLPQLVLILIGTSSYTSSGKVLRTDLGNLADYIPI